MQDRGSRFHTKLRSWLAKVMGIVGVFETAHPSCAILECAICRLWIFDRAGGDCLDGGHAGVLKLILIFLGFRCFLFLRGE